ncbi:MAG: acyl-CoA dehydrogenase family protein [Sphingobium sp.]
MNFDLSDEQKMLAEQAREMLGEMSTPDRLRKLIDAGAEWDEPLWRQLTEMGFLGAAIPEDAGGLGMTQIDLGVISEELGRANVSLPFFSSIVLAADAIRLAGTPEQQQAWLPRLASGEVVGTFAYAEGKAGWTADAVHAEYEDGTITGIKTPVADGGIAQIAVVLVRSGADLALALVELDQPSVTRDKLASFDQLRAHYALRFDGAKAQLLGEADGTRVLEELFDRAAVQAAFESVGAADACLSMARNYALDRQIFGRALASYQSIKHKLADLAVAIEMGRSNAYYAAWAAGSAPEELPAAAAAARLTGLAAFEMGARENLQVHGGIGYTFEADCHFYYRRERTVAVSLGSRQYWADRLIANTPEAHEKAA